MSQHRGWLVLVRRIVFSVLGVILVGVGCVLVLMIVPGTPQSTQSLKFQGYVLLPKGAKTTGALGVLDYLTVVDRSLFVANANSGDVYKVKLIASAVPGAADVSVMPGDPEAHGVAIDPITSVAFVTRSEVNAVDTFDPATMRPLGRIPVAEDPDAILYDPYDKLIYVSNGHAKVATLIDPATRTTIGVIPLGGEPEFPAFDPVTKLIYQNLSDTDVVAVVDVAKRMVVQRWPLRDCSSPTSATIDATERRLFVVCGKTARFLALDLVSHQVVASLPIGARPDSVAYDPDLHRIYTAGVAGTMSVIQEDAPDTYHLLKSVNLRILAHTLAIDPATHRVYAGYAGLFAQPRLAVFDAQP